MFTYFLHRVSTNSLSTVGQKYCCCGKQFLYSQLRAAQCYVSPVKDTSVAGGEECDNLAD